MSSEASCYDCKLETIQIRWTQLLLNWINQCVLKKKKAINKIDSNTLHKVIKKYNDDISVDKTDKALLSSGQLGLFIKYKYPMAQLQNLSEEAPDRLYIMASVLLFHCCISSKSGKVHTDICAELNKVEQEMILKYCETLTECEVCIDNVENAIRVACENLEPIDKPITAECKKTTISKTINAVPINYSMKSTESNQREKKRVMIQERNDYENKKLIKFKPSITSIPSNKSCDCTSTFNGEKIDRPGEEVASSSKDTVIERVGILQEYSGGQDFRCQSQCACTRCGSAGLCCGEPAVFVGQCEKNWKKPSKDTPIKRSKFLTNWKLYLVLVIGVLLAIGLLSAIFIMPSKKQEEGVKRKRSEESVSFFPDWAWECKKNLCHKVFKPKPHSNIHSSLGRCNLICMGPQLWPHPIGFTHFSKTLVGLATNKLEYNFLAIPSDKVHQHLAQAFKLFIKDLITLEKSNFKPKNRTDLQIKKMHIQIEVDSDADPRMRLDTDETYLLKMDPKGNQLLIRISATSFCGVRHGLETLSQMIVLDQTSGYLMTVSEAMIKDGPSFHYRGLMIDTGRNFIPASDLMRTIDGMAACKLNTLHWRISDVASFPLEVPEVPELLEYGPYDRSMVYSKEDVKSIVNRADIRGIRVLIEVALPGPVGRPWSWSTETTCSKKNDNFTCDSDVCLRLKMEEPVFDALQIIYSEILDLMKVDDVFHLSDGVFSISNCFSLIEDREGFLDKALKRLKKANKGVLPQLPIIWYTEHLTKDFEAKSWEGFGVQLNDWDPNLSYELLAKFKVIHSSKWDLSCEMKNKRCTKYRTWQEMYSWKTWRYLDVFSVEGGEAVLWTDLVDSGNLDSHLWPRTAAIAERLWSDAVANSTANRFVYTRLDTHRSRMLLRGIQVQPIWPAWCSYNPSVCLDKLS